MKRRTEILLKNDDKKSVKKTSKCFELWVLLINTGSTNNERSPTIDCNRLPTQRLQVRIVAWHIAPEIREICEKWI